MKDKMKIKVKVNRHVSKVRDMNKQKVKSQ